jgi:peptidoglycan/xylan/chitin deacetylase (PgdA/CDA1 family)
VLATTRKAIARLRSSFARRGVILVYHSIAEVLIDPWALHVSPTRFDDQLRRLVDAFPVVPLDFLASMARNKSLRRPVVAITFDDGYANNLHSASAILSRWQAPATVFVTSGFVGQAEECWWDILERYLFLGDFSADLQVNFEENTPLRIAELGTSEIRPSWRAWQEPSGNREAAYVSLWQGLKDLDDRSRSAVLAQIREQAKNCLAPRESHRMLTVRELQTLAKKPSISIGAHTESHPVMSTLPPDHQRREVLGSKLWLEQMTGQVVTSFAYPFGKGTDVSVESVEAVKSAELEVACLNAAGSIRNGTDRFLMPRMHVGDWCGDELVRRIRSLLVRS